MLGRMKPWSRQARERRWWDARSSLFSVMDRRAEEEWRESELGEDHVSEVVGWLRANEGGLVELDLRDSDVGEYECRTIGETLALNTTLPWLYLENNLAGDAVALAIRLSWGQGPGELIEW